MPDETEESDPQFTDFCEKAERSLVELFSSAQAVAEVQFAFALSPEMRGMQDAGWNTAAEAFRAVDEFIAHIKSMPFSAMQVRVALSLYSHVSEASGFYEIPKNMMRIASGEEYHLWPFMHLVQRRQERGAVIAPNANKVMKDLVGHADELGLVELKAVLLQAFDPDLRNGYAHADYIIWDDGIRLRRRNGGFPRIVSFEEFSGKLNRALAFFEIMKQVVSDFMQSYNPPRRVIGAPNNQDLPLPTIISFDPDTRSFSIVSGMGL